MPAHVIYPAVDNRPAGFSSVWLQQILRQKLNFQGVIFSDDLSMHAAGESISFAEKAQKALTAGCDMVLVCNHVDAAQQVLSALENYSNGVSQTRIIRMQGKKTLDRAALMSSPQWTIVTDKLARLNAGEF